MYLSTEPKFHRAFLESEFQEQSSADSTQPIVAQLLWDERLDSPSFSKSFLLTTLSDSCNGLHQECDARDQSYASAVAWLDQADKTTIDTMGGGVLSAISAAGQGIESTSFLLSLYQAISKQFRKFLVLVSLADDIPDTDWEREMANRVLQRKTIHLSENSHIWKSLQSNSTIYVHALLIRNRHKDSVWPPTTLDEAVSAIRTASRSHSFLTGLVDMLKFEPPHHIGKPTRVLVHDIQYFWSKYVLGNLNERPPWDMEYSKPRDFQNFQTMQEMKKKGMGYPYWKPEVAIKLVNEEDAYPRDLAGLSGMPIVQVTSSREHPTGFAFVPAMHVDEIGLTSEKYIPVNSTVTSLPLRISFDRNDMQHSASRATATAGGMSPARWRLLSHLSGALEAQKDLGFEQSDIDDLRRLIADTNVALLGITMLFSALHLLFEFLTFKSEVSFWRNNKDLTGLSVRSLFMDMIGQSVILMFLIEKNSSLLMTIPSAIGCLIALWKCQRASGLQFVKVRDSSDISWWNRIPSWFGYELRATRLEIKVGGADPSNTDEKGIDMTRVTMEADRTATRTLGSILLPLVVGYTLYSLLYEEHTGWYTWLITSASSAVYALGFVLMTPQLFLNWKLKSVAHLPWRVLVYKSLNTFIDDLFSFIIRMPTMARISCFRDDIVFFIYLYQRWLYPVDKSRPVEGGGDLNEGQQNAEKEKKNQ